MSIGTSKIVICESPKDLKILRIFMAPKNIVFRGIRNIYVAVVMLWFSFGYYYRF